MVTKGTKITKKKFNFANSELCVRLSNEGKNVTQIHKKLNRTQDWVYKWLKRAQSVQFDLGNSP